MKKTYLIALNFVFPLCIIAQNVGIGTLTPQRKLEVLDTQSPFVARFTSSIPHSAIRFGTDAQDFLELGQIQGDGYIKTLTNADLSLGVNGYTAMRIQAATGRVGIGNLTPNAMLHVEGFLEPEVGYFVNYGDSSRIRVANTQTQTELGSNLSLGYVGTLYENDFAIRTHGQNRMTFINSSGYVGLGTTTPSDLFHVYSAGASTNLAKFESNGGFGQVLVTNGSITSDLGADPLKGYVGTNSDHDFTIRAGADDIISLKHGSKYVGIGTSNPECILNVVTDNPLSATAIFKNNAGNSSVLVAGAQTLGLVAYQGVCQVGSFTPCDLQLNTFGVPRLTVQNSTGNLGIATENPAYRLQVNSINSEPSTIADFHALGFYGKIQLSTALPLTAVLGADLYTAYVGTDSWHDFALRVAGNNVVTINASSHFVGIGTTSPTANLDIAGSLKATGSASLSNTTITGTLSVSNATTLNGSLLATGATTLIGPFVVNNNTTVNGSLTVNSIVQSDRIDVTFYNNNFHNLGAPYENVTYYKDKENRVHLSGVVEIVGTQSGTMFILPSGFRPLGNQMFAQMTSSGSVIRINVNSTGNVTIQGSLSGWVSVDGISFRAN